MTYAPVDVQAFGGLDFSDEQDATGAIDLLNCVIDQQGKLSVRPGYTVNGSGTSGVGASGSLAYNALDSYTNLVTNSTFESGVGDWTATNGTLAQGGTAGSRYATLTQSGPATDAKANTNEISITSGNAYNAQVTITAVSAGIKDVSVYVRWYNGTTLLQSDLFDPPSGGGGISASITGTYSNTRLVAPGTANKAKVWVEFTYKYGSVSFDSVLLTSGSYSGSFFTGTVSSSSTNVICGYRSTTDTVRLLSATGASVDSKASLTTGNDWNFVAVGGAAWGANGKAQIVKGTTSALTQPNFETKDVSETSFIGSRRGPIPKFLAKQTPDNRLVAAGFIGASDGPQTSAAGPSYTYAATTAATIFFSQPDRPDRWDLTDYVIVGDSADPITGIASWNDQLVVFKDDEWFVFYGNSTDVDGGSVFNYRRIEPGCKMISWAVGVNGVYVTDANSNIYVFTGGVPQLVFRGSSRYQALPGQGFNAHPLVGLPAQAPFGNETLKGYLIVDDRLRQVYFFSFDMNLTAGSNSGQAVIFPYTTGLATFPDGSTDNGADITASYTSAYSSFGQPGMEKTIRQSEVHGSGAVSLSWGRDLQPHGRSSTVRMLEGRGVSRDAVRGETLSWKITGTGWSINRIVHYLRETRLPGVKT